MKRSFNMSIADPAAVTVLVVCTGNAGRSQLAEAFCTSMAQGVLHALSAGVQPWRALHPMTVRILDDRGIDHSALHPKAVDTFLDRSIDMVVTIGDPARIGLPRQFLDTAEHVHWNIADPAEADGTDASEPTFRRTAHEIELSVRHLIEVLTSTRLKDPQR
jgi:protein-tyrosine-phosphatase